MFVWEVVEHSNLTFSCSNDGTIIGQLNQEKPFNLFTQSTVVIRYLLKNIQEVTGY